MYAGFDIGGTTARAHLFDETYTSRDDVTRSVRSEHTPEALAHLVLDILADWRRDHADESIEAVGIGLAAQLDPKRGVVHNAPNLGWRDVPWVEMLRDASPDLLDDTPIVLVNDLNAILLGEHLCGAVEDVEDVLAVYVGTGVGGAILSEGTLVEGGDGFAGELGHTKVELGGRLCGCGQRGCVEAYAGGIHLERRVERIAREHHLETLWEDEHADSIDLEAADRALETVEELDALWTEATDALGRAIADACTLLNPHALLLGGGILEHLETYRRRSLAAISPSILEVARTNLEVRSPDLGDRAGVLGAAVRARQHL